MEYYQIAGIGLMIIGSFLIIKALLSKTKKPGIQKQYIVGTGFFLIGIAISTGVFRLH